MHLRGSALALPLLVSLSLPLAGCYGDPEGFAKNGAKHACKRARECDKSNFDEQYGGDLGRCKDELYTDYLDYNDALENLGCEYDPDAGQACASTIRKLKNDCSDDAEREIVDACGLLLDEIYDCPGPLERAPTHGAAGLMTPAP